MSTVEELGDGIIAMAVEPSAIAEVIEKLDSLIAAARAEGAERERERIRRSGEFLSKGRDVRESVYFEDLLLRETGDFASVAVFDCYIVPADVFRSKEEA